MYVRGVAWYPDRGTTAQYTGTRNGIVVTVKRRITKGRYTGTVGEQKSLGTLRLADGSCISVTSGNSEEVASNTPLVLIEDGQQTTIHPRSQAMRDYDELVQLGFPDGLLREYERKHKGYELVRRGLFGRIRDVFRRN